MQKSQFFAYYRVSTSKQRQENTIENQKINIANYLKSHSELRVIREFEDNGISGFSNKRKDFLDMISKLDEVDGIILDDLSRLSRSALDLLKFIDLLLSKKKDLITVSGLQLDTTSPEGLFAAHNYCAFIQYNAESLKQRLQSARKIAQANGQKMGRKEKELDDREICRLYNLGLGSDSIQKQIRDKEGNVVCKTTIYKRLKHLERLGKLTIRKRIRT